MYLLYSFLLAAGVLVTSPYWIYRAVRDRKYFGNFRQRLGWGIPEIANGERPVWVHAVSVGEVLAARPLVSALRKRRPDLAVAVSTVTLTGQAQARKEFSGFATVFYFPFDWSVVTSRYLGRLRPQAVVLMETELWPNFLASAFRRGVPVILVNGRVSDKSLRRYRLVRPFVGRMVRCLAAVAAQSAEDRERFLRLGVPAERAVVTGNLKYDFPEPSADGDPPWIELIRRALGAEAKVVVVGSTMKGEEEALLVTFRKLLGRFPCVRLILAPRHPERFDEVESVVRGQGLRCGRRSALTSFTSDTSVLLLDSMGELRTVYALADVAVIGGSFLPYGGHNILEPAVLSKAVVFGPYMSNFRDMAALFRRQKAAIQCSLEELPATLGSLLSDDAGRTALGQRAGDLVRANQGATEQTIRLLQQYLR